MSALEKPKCPLCKDSGFVRPPNQNGVVRCECVKAKIEAAQKFNVHPDWPIPTVLSEATFEKFSIKGAPPSVREANAQAQDYTARLMTGKPAGGILFAGAVGTGKSHLAVAILKQANMSAIFAPVPGIMRRMRDSFSLLSQGADSKLLKGLCEAPVLVLDDVGAERITGYSEETFYVLVNERYSNRRPTIFTTNKSLVEGQGEMLADWVGERSFDRMMGLCWQNDRGRLNVVQMIGQSKRWGA
jgi:DNA replication protein DnaC